MSVETQPGSGRETGSKLVGEISGVTEIRRRGWVIIHHLCLETTVRDLGKGLTGVGNVLYIPFTI